MEAYDFRSIMNGNPRKYTISKEMDIVMKCFDEVLEKNNIEDFSKYDYLYAGYILSNPLVREQLTMNKKHELNTERLKAGRHEYS